MISDVEYAGCNYQAHARNGNGMLFSGSNEKDAMEQEHEAAIEEFRRRVDAGETDTHPYDRLMIHYRKKRLYAEELQVIRRGIAVFMEQLKRQRSALLKTGKRSTAIKTLSSQLSKATGLTDKKGQELYMPEPLPRWNRRKATVEEKIKKAKAKKNKK